MTTDTRTLHDVLADTRLSYADTIRYGLQIADALKRVHAEGRCHGALAPDLILVGPAGVEVLPPPPEASGNWGPYSAPEVLLDQPIDTRSDIFALGTILYEMATGGRAFRSQDAHELVEEILTRKVGSTGNDGLDEVVKNCLVKDPSLRWSKIQRVRMELKLVSITTQQRQAVTFAQFEHNMREELIHQAEQMAELEKAVAVRTGEMTKAVSTALNEVQVQFAEVEQFLAASQQRFDQFAKSANQSTDAIQTEIESMKASMARSDDFVERLVDALDGLQNAVFRPTPAAELVPMSLAS